MAPTTEPKRRVKSIKKPVDPAVKVKKPKKDKRYSRAYINKLVKKVLKRRANSNDSVPLIYRTYRRMVKMACDMVARRHRRITTREAQLAMARLIPREVAMNAIREFHQQPKEEAVVSGSAAPTASSSKE